MNEYKVITVSGTVLQWFAVDTKTARKEAEDSGHKVRRIVWVPRKNQPEEF